MEDIIFNESEFENLDSNRDTQTTVNSQEDIFTPVVAPKPNIIKVVGVGGGGGNAVNHMFDEGIQGVDFILCNTDYQALLKSNVPTKIHLGKRDLGAGNDPAVGREAALNTVDDLNELFDENTKMLFITAGMGGGTGTGAAPIVAKIAKDKGILTVGIVTLPFECEGRRRKQQALNGIAELRKNVDTILIISNDKLRDEYGNMKLTEAFMKADDVLKTAAKGIAEIITVTGYVNVDFEDVSTVMRGSGKAIMGSAKASGEDRAKKAIEEAIHSPLLSDSNIAGAKNILIYITSGSDEVSLDEVVAITEHVQEICGNTSDVIWGNGIDESLGDAIAVTLIATGFGNEKYDAPIGDIETAPEKKVFTIKNEDTIPSAERKENIFKTEEKKIFDLNTGDKIDAIEDETTQPCKPIESVIGTTEKTIHDINDHQVEAENEIQNSLAEKAVEKQDPEAEIKAEEEKVAEEHTKPIIHALGQDDEMMTASNQPVKEDIKPEPETSSFKKEESVIKVKKYDNPFQQNEDDDNDFVITSRKSLSQIEAEEQMSSMAVETLVDETSNQTDELDSNENLRKQRLKALSLNYNTSKGLEHLESQPAYMRRNVAIESHEDDLSSYSDTKNGLRADNPFLDDNVD